MAKDRSAEGQVKDIGKAIYEEYLASKSPFPLDDFEDKLMSKILAEHPKLARKLYGTAIHKIVKDIDDEYGKKREYPSLPGMEGVDLGGRYNTGNKMRVAKRYATWDDYLKAREIDDKETERKALQNSEMHADGDKIEAYWNRTIRGQRVTKEQAWELYLRDHPEELPPEAS
jgi:hypothetical protein